MGLQNEGGAKGPRWRRSFKTKTWPSVVVPDPIPIVGMDKSFVISSERFASTHSKTMAKQPASSRA